MTPDAQKRLVKSIDCEDLATKVVHLAINVLRASGPKVGAKESSAEAWFGAVGEAFAMGYGSIEVIEIFRIRDSTTPQEMDGLADLITKANKRVWLEVYLTNRNSADRIITKLFTGASKACLTPPRREEELVQHSVEKLDANSPWAVVNWIGAGWNGITVHELSFPYLTARHLHLHQYITLSFTLSMKSKISECDGPASCVESS